MRDLDLPPIALEYLTTRNASRTAPTTDPLSLTHRLTVCGCPIHPAVLEFEASYGGIQLIESDPEVPTLVVGPFACHSPSFRSRDEDRVMVMHASNDIVYALDAEGGGWAWATMCDGPRRAARDGRELFTQALLWRALETHPKSYDFLEGRQGEARAQELGLTPIDDASCEYERWWGSLDRLLVEIERGNGFEGPITYLAR